MFSIRLTNLDWGTRKSTFLFAFCLIYTFLNSLYRHTFIFTFCFLTMGQVCLLVIGSRDQDYLRNWPGVPLVNHVYLRSSVCYCFRGLFFVVLVPAASIGACHILWLLAIFRPNLIR